MAQTYNFQTPRHLYEKLCRDSEKLDVVIDGDHLFNFISTAHHLQDWIKKSPLKSSTTIKRFLKKLNSDDNLKICSDVVAANTHFEINPAAKGCQLKVSDSCIDAKDFKNEIMEMYEVYFKIKGH
ncbi:MAG: hypothetical protein KDC88_11415 [Ignavibacteriae bacterium]|nr:hypothetical protein [Ignavibacteriota bacterium]MCB9207325.1 hypothetical protein [Ignavibacteriales bacterium]MCB9208998.1 hypothetical protein [Ignavibacteriales bacterium]MCB9218080.1 hypothetical protein [Ignavibacteriales bacterium]MCB9260469.1 hypothetical protein [Ignavibacteriales bacterium]